MNNDIDIEKLRNYINDLEEKITPLTKSRPKKDVKPVKEIKEEPVDDSVEEEEEPEPEPIKKKITRTVTEKKKEQLIKAREIKKENMEKRNKLKKLESAKLLLKEEISKPKPKPKPDDYASKELASCPARGATAGAVRRSGDLISSESASEVETDEEIIVVKKKAKPKPKKKPKKKIIIQEEDTTTEEEESEEEEVQVRPRSKSFGKSHRNKKSVVKVHQHPSHNQPMNYFCD
jgi:hypothetical protein